MSRLPSGYIEVEYIETSGTQYIDTGFIPNQDSRVVCRFQYLGGTHIYGARQNASSSTSASGNFVLRSISSVWQPCYGSTLGSTKVACDNGWHIADQNKNIFTLDGVAVAEGAELGEGTTVENRILTRVFDEQQFTAPLSFLLGAINSASGGGNIYCGRGRFSSCRLYDNGVLVRDYLPCRTQAGEVGMYDLVTEAFFGNSGSGVFAAGSIVVAHSMITDRGAQDVDRVKFLAEKAWQDMTAEEKAEWLSPLKGAYNHTDLNRVEEAVAHVAEQLQKYGYLSYLPATRSWSVEEKPTEHDLSRYFGNVATLRRSIAVWASTPAAPNSIVGFGANEANALEQILVDVDQILTRISQVWFYSGDLYSAEV